MTKEEREFFDGCEAFKNYGSLDEYIADIHKWLTLSSWKYSDEAADRHIKANMAYIERAYENREPAADVGAEVGFCGG